MTVARLLPAKSAPSLPTHVHRNRLTPRSAEACRRTGIEPSELLPLPQSAFQEPGQSPLIAKQRWERYEELRLEAYQAVRAEREKVIADGGVTNLGRSEGETASAPNFTDEAVSTAADMDRRVIEKIKKKQQAEIEQMLMFEISQARQLSEKEDKVRAEKAKEEARRLEREQRAKETAEFRRRTELERKEAEERSEKEARRRQQEEMRRDAKRREEEEEAERQRLVELDRKERERIAKAEARRLRQKELLEEQQAEMKRKEEQKAEQERERLQRLEEKRQAQAEENARARARQQERIEQTLLQNQERLAQQRSQYLQKMQKEEERRQAFEAEKEAEILAKQQAGIEKREHIKQCQLQMEAVVQERKDGVMKKELHHEQMKQEADEVRQREQESKIAEREMRLYAIQLAHMRSQRRTEYQREVMASKIELEAARTDHLLQSRRAQLVQRKDMRSKSCRAKEDVTARMDKMRTSSSFDIDDELRQYIHNPDLRELLDRCDEKCKGGKVPLDTMRSVLYEMQKEGKLLSGTR